MFAHNIVGKGKAKAGPLVCRFGGKERIENFIDNLGRDPIPIISYAYLYPIIQAPGAQRQGREIGHTIICFDSTPFLVGSITGIAYHIEKDAPKILWNNLNLPRIWVEIRLDGQVKIRVSRPCAVVGKAGVFIEQIVNFNGQSLTRAAPHHEHVVNNAVGAGAVLEDAPHVVGEVLAYLVNQFALLLAQCFGNFVQYLHQLFHEFFRRFREVFHKIQRILDLMRHTCSEFAERGQFLAHDNLVLRHLQILQHFFELCILRLQLFCQFFHQIQALHLQSVAAKDFKGCGHVCHLVVPTDLDLALQVAISHAAHPFG